MALNNPYVPGDPYSYDLKWMVQEVKAAQAVGEQAAGSAAAAAASAEAAAASAEQSGDWEADARLYAQNAELSAQNAAASAEEAAGVVAPITQALNAQGQQISVLEGRMDTFSSLTEGSTTGDAELQDIRVAADGTVYPTAGDAVRGQVNNLKNAITALEDVVVFKVELNALNTVTPFIVHPGDSVTIRAKDGSPLTVQQLRLVRADKTNDYWSVTGQISRTISVTENFVGVFVHGGTEQDVIVEKSGSPLNFQPQIDVINTQLNSYGESTTITPENVHTGYIHRDGRIMTSDTFRYTDPIFVERGTIIFKALGYSNNVSLLALCDAKGENRVSLVTSTPNAGTESVNYRIPYPMYLIISSQQSVPIQYTIIKDNSLIPEMISLSLFTHFGVIGDSYASGKIYYGDTYKTDYAHSWGQLIAKKFGTTCTNYSKGGLSTRTWLTDAKGLPLVLSSEPEDVYYLALGINDAWSLGIDYLGSLSDITSHSSYVDYPDTFYGNYGRIIEQVIAHAPHAKLIMFTLAQTGEPNPQFSAAIQEIANHYNIPCAVELDDVFFTSPLFREFLIGGHPSGLGYGGMAAAMERLIVNCVAANAAYFNDIYGYDD